MSGLAGLLRGLTHRAGSTLVVLLVALVASAAASLGPMYDASARTSILRDSLASASLVERGFEVTHQGVASSGIGPLSDSVQSDLGQLVPHAADRARLFAAPIDAVEAGAFFRDLDEQPPLVWRTDFCAQLRMVDGRCASAPNDVVVSSSLASRNHWRVGERLTPSGWPALTVAGIYAVPDVTAPYWFDRGNVYFATEDAAGGRAPDAPPQPDAMFTPLETINDATDQPQGTLVVDQLLNTSAVHAGDLPTLAGLSDGLQRAIGYSGAAASVDSQLGTLASTVRASWRALAVPVFLVSVELAVLVWLLMYLVVTEVIDSRGPEIALMKLRGLRGRRLLAFALGEPLALLALAYPLGVLAGWGASALLDRVLLRAGTPMELPALGWAAAAVATLGGLVASAVGARRTLRRTIIDQWRYASRDAAKRGWALDTMVATAAVAGLVELIVGGHITSVGQGSLGLLVPGVLGLAVAVLAARLLPLACRALFGVTRRRGGIGPFLAVRHVARRSAGLRTTIILATAFALGSFGVCAWSTGQSNRALVAGIAVGAPTVLDVSTPTGTDLGAVVDRLDPGGQRAAVVDNYFDATGSSRILLAVDPQRFAAVATWRAGFADQSLAALTKQLAPPVAPPVPLDGDEIRVRLDVEQLSRSDLLLSADLSSPLAGSALYLQLGAIDVARGALTLTAPLKGCPCTLADLSVGTAVASGLGGGDPIKGALTIEGIDVHGPNGWTSLSGLDKVDQWRAVTGGSTSAGGSGDLASTPQGLHWPFDVAADTTADLQVADLPDPLPAIVDRQAAAGGGLAEIQASGIDGNALVVKPFAVVGALPGTGGGGIVVDRGYAERAAAGLLSSLTTRQVWVTDAAAPSIEAGLRKAGVQITSTASSAAQAHAYDRQGPGLASVAFLADALTATVLAAAAAIMGLVTAGRRRRFEYAALQATGASRRALYTGLLIEQSAVLVFGALVGVVAGVAAALVTTRSVPEFVVAPAAPALSYAPHAGPLAAFVLVALAVLIVVAAVSSRVLLAGARPDQLREAQQ